MAQGSSSWPSCLAGGFHEHRRVSGRGASRRAPTVRFHRGVVRASRMVAFVRWLRQVSDMPALLAAMLLGFLLIQPAICLIHCATTTSPPSVGPRTGSHLFCSLSQPQSSHIATTPVPAFWPTLPAMGFFVLTPVTTWLFVLICIAAYILSPPWSPPIPPPRGIPSEFWRKTRFQVPGFRFTVRSAGFQYFTVQAGMWHRDALDLKPETLHLKPCLKGAKDSVI